MGKELEAGKEVKEVKEKSGEQEEKKATPYYVFGSDILVTEGEFIDYYKTRMKMMAITYKLVGRVGNDGKYVIADDIKADLIKMEKEIEDSGDNYYKAIALYMKKHFIFSIRLEMLEDGRGKASLYLSEFVDNFLGQEYIVSHIGDYIDNYDDEFRIRVRKAFHLVDVEVKNDDMAVPNLAVVMQDQFDLELIVGGLYDMASQIYIMRMLKLLSEEGGEVGKKILERYYKLIDGQNIEVNAKFRYSSYKAILDKVMDEFGGIEKLGINPEAVKAIVQEMNHVVKAIDKASQRPGAIEGEFTKPETKDKVKAAVKPKAKTKAPLKPAKQEKAKAAAKKVDKPKAKEEEVKKGKPVTAPSKPKIIEVEPIDDIEIGDISVLIPAQEEPTAAADVPPAATEPQQPQPSLDDEGEDIYDMDDFDMKALPSEREMEDDMKSFNAFESMEDEKNDMAAFSGDKADDMEPVKGIGQEEENSL